MQRFYTLKQAAKLCGVKPLTIHRWVKAGILPDRRLPGTHKHRFLATDLVREPQQQAA